MDRRCESDLMHLRHAARLALRGHGGAEPNPLVGCVIVSPPGKVVGWGHHARFGGPHAEINALRRAGERARGATLYCTLEPCDHTGRTGPCTLAIIKAGIARVVVARRDPNPVAAGGLDRLRSAGIAVEVNDESEPAIMVSDPFAQRVRSGLPWVTVKWAQTIDGRIATRTGESRWISGEASRRLVHKERGRADVILTGIGTVLRDDPMLTARGVRCRRIARRVVIDPTLQMPLRAKLVESALDVPTTVVCGEHADKIHPERVAALRDRGVAVDMVTLEGDELPLGPVLRGLVAVHEATHVLVEAGPGLMGRLFRQRLANEAWVFVGPTLLGDREAPAAVQGMTAARLAEGMSVRLMDMRRRGDDAMLRYRVIR